MSWQITTILLLVVIGILNTLYLAWHSYTKTPVKCLFFPPDWCEKVQGSKYSKILGIPNSYLGVLMYVLLLLFALMYVNGSAIWPLAFIIYFGFAFSLYFTYIQAFVLRAFCTWCVLSALDFTLLFIVLLTV